MTPEPTHEDRYVAALCHVSLLVNFFSLAVPLVVWIMRRKESAHLRFQAAQALAFQLAGFAAQTVLIGLQIVASFGFMGIMIVLAVMSEAMQASASSGIIFGLFFVLIWGVMLLVVGLQSVVGLIYLALGLWGALQMLRGRAFRYPLLGNWIDRRLSPAQPVSAPQPVNA